MIRELPPDWAPVWPLPAETPFARLIDRVYGCIPFWDQALIALGLVAYVGGMGWAIVHMA